MKRKCDKCKRSATLHSVEINKGQKVEINLCDIHAAEAGLASTGPGHASINEVLTNFVKLHSGLIEDQDVTCDHCGLTYRGFQEGHLLGCPQCYQAFEAQLTPLLERAHEGGSNHLGKVPRRLGLGEQRQEQLLRMRQRLSDAVTGEDYELAAHWRDEIERMEDRT